MKKSIIFISLGSFLVGSFSCSQAKEVTKEDFETKVNNLLDYKESGFNTVTIKGNVNGSYSIGSASGNSYLKIDEKYHIDKDFNFTPYDEKDQSYYGVYFIQSYTIQNVITMYSFYENSIQYYSSENEIIIKATICMNNLESNTEYKRNNYGLLTYFKQSASSNYGSSKNGRISVKWE